MEELREKLRNAARLEAKEIKDRIQNLERQRINYEKELGKFDDQIKRKQALIARLDEKASKTSIKTTVIGKDADMSEYWFFKDDPNKVYIRKEEHVPVEGPQFGDLEMADETGKNGHLNGNLG